MAVKKYLGVIIRQGDYDDFMPLYEFKDENGSCSFDSIDKDDRSKYICNQYEDIDVNFTDKQQVRIFVGKRNRPLPCIVTMDLDNVTSRGNSSCIDLGSGACKYLDYDDYKWFRLLEDDGNVPPPDQLIFKGVPSYIRDDEKVYVRYTDQDTGEEYAVGPYQYDVVNKKCSAVNPSGGQRYAPCFEILAEKTLTFQINATATEQNCTYVRIEDTLPWFEDFASDDELLVAFADAFSGKDAPLLSKLPPLLYQSRMERLMGLMKDQTKRDDMLKNCPQLQPLVELSRQKSMLEAQVDVLCSSMGSILKAVTHDAVDYALEKASGQPQDRDPVNYEAIRDAWKPSDKNPAVAKLDKYLVDAIQKKRPDYTERDILNILICYTQGFLTVFSGEPGTGKTSVCGILADALGLRAEKLGCTRYIHVPVERGWTSKRDFIGYYNPLTKSFDRSNRSIFDALNILDLEKDSGYRPFVILLDEANLSQMEYYWGDFMNLYDFMMDPDDQNGTSRVVDLGEHYRFQVPKHLHFLATINSDHTTDVLSPRLIDRSWIIQLPKPGNGSSGNAAGTGSISLDPSKICWEDLVKTFGPRDGARKELDGDLLTLCHACHLEVSYRVRNAIRDYRSAAEALFGGKDAAIDALDFAVAQRILPHINGIGDTFGTNLEELKKYCDGKRLKRSADILENIIEKGKSSRGYYHFFA